jgi:hypothetical protein
MFAKGGYTGDIDPKKPAGVIHGKEFVFNAEAVKTIGLGTLEEMHQRAQRGDRMAVLSIAHGQPAAGGSRGFSDGGYTGDMGAAEVAGVVHGREFVFSAPAVQAIGRDTLDTLHERAAAGDRTALRAHAASAGSTLASVAHANLFAPHQSTGQETPAAGGLRELVIRSVPVAGQREMGGPVSAGSLYRVNERGPELLEVGGAQYLMMGAQGGNVTSAPDTASRMQGGGGHPIHVHVAMPAGGSRATAQQWGAEAGRHIEASMRRNGVRA